MKTFLKGVKYEWQSIKWPKVESVYMQFFIIIFVSLVVMGFISLGNAVGLRILEFVFWLSSVS